MIKNAQIETNNKLLNATIVGLVPALLEGVLIYYADSKTDHWVLAQSILFWFSCGFVLFLTEIGTKKIRTCIFLTLLLNIPWYIALVIIAKKTNHLIPLLVSSVIMGTIIGYISLYITRKNKN